jgi:hypothetical protein
MISKIVAILILSVPLLGAPQWTVPFVQRNGGSVGPPCSSLPFSDSFTRANGPLGSPWTTSSGSTIAISSDQVTPGAYASGPQNAWPAGCPGWTTSHYAQAVFESADSASRFGLTVQTQDQSNYYYIECTTGGGCSLLTNIAGTPTYIDTFSLYPTAGQTFCLELDSGSTAKLKVNGSYDPYSWSVSGLSGTGGGGLYFGTQSTPGAFLGNFQTGNGTCP